MALFGGLSVLAAEVASASTVAQAARGVGITVAGVTGAGAAGVRPAPVQDSVAAAVETVSPSDLPDSHDSTDDDTPGQGRGDTPGTDDSVEDIAEEAERSGGNSGRARATPPSTTETSRDGA